MSEDTIFIQPESTFMDGIYIAGKDPEPAHSDKLIIVYLDYLKHPFAYRTEDFPIVKGILEDKEYDLSFAQGFVPKNIIDCGGHIGTAAVYFANKYPTANIYSIEPQIDNFKLLMYNSVFYENIHQIRSAIWNKITNVNICDKGYGSAGYVVEETDTISDNLTGTSTKTIISIMEEYGFDTIDILKIDIEGSEKELFNDENVHEWLGKVKVLIIELHDRIKKGCFDAVIKAISRYNWFFTFKGENIILLKQ